jgi:hypothetical protein
VEDVDGAGLVDLLPPGEPVSGQLPGAEDVAGFRCSDDLVSGALEGAACVGSEIRGADWGCAEALGFVPPAPGETLGAATAGWRAVAAGADPLRLKLAGGADLTGAIGAC